MSDVRDDDVALIARLRAGDLDAFEELHRRHAGRLFTLARRLLGDEHDAEDALQDVFLQAFRKLAEFRGDAALGTWLYRLMANLCLDRLRSRAHKADRQTDSLDALTLVPPSGSARPDMTFSRIDLERAIAALPDRCRAAFVLHDVEGFDHREVGVLLGISEGTSKSQVHKARLRLRGRLSATATSPDETSRSQRS